MTQILATAVNAIFPIILLILLGYFLKRIKFLTKDFLKVGNNLVFKLCLPSMLFLNVYGIDNFSAVQWNLIWYCLAVIAVLFTVGFLTAVFFTKVPQRKGVLMQCIFRSNFAIIGLSLAGALGGDKAVGVAAVVSAFTIPVFNIISVVALIIFAQKAENKWESFKKILLNIAKNPLIIGVLSGFLCLGIRTAQVWIFGEPVFTLKGNLTFVYKALENLKAIASPLALIILGGNFEFSAVRGLLKEIIAGTVGRIVAAPLIGIGGAVLLSKYTNFLSCGAAEYPALIALFGTPVAVASGIMAGAMENDEQLAAQLVVWTSICSIMTLFLTVCILMAAGLLNVQ